MARRWQKNRFYNTDDDPLGPLANLLDLMLVFACGLIAALIAMSSQVEQHFNQPAEQVIERGKELLDLPNNASQGGSGYTPVGKVFKDPKTGKLILISE